MNGNGAGGVREGDLLAGKYRIDKVLGEGGMGVVVAAHHIALDERVAIKFLLPEVLHNEEAVLRFAREARAAVKIKSEHVAKVSDVGKLENGAPYMVMEYLDGSDLAAWLGQRGALPVEQAVEFVLQASEAIAEAHALGIIHRDLKPANLFVIRRADGMLSVKVLDFGISKTTGLAGSGAGQAMTRTSALMGSPLYMSPEQMASARDVDARSDIWALGVILYELVAGSPPFNGETMPELVLRVVQGGPEPLRNKRADLPPGFEEVVLRCLEKDASKRFESVGALAVALIPFGPKRSRISVERISGVMRSAGLSASALALPPSSGDEAPVARTGGSWGRTTAPSGRSRWLAVAALCGVVTVAFAAWWSSRRAEPSADKPVVEPSAVTATPPQSAPAAPAVIPTPAPSVVAPPPDAAAHAARPAKVKHPASPPKVAAPSTPPAVAPAVHTATPAPAPTPTPAPPARHDPNIFDDRK